MAAATLPPWASSMKWSPAIIDPAAGRHFDRKRRRQLTGKAAAPTPQLTPIWRAYWLRNRCSSSSGADQSIWPPGPAMNPSSETPNE
jgi:hypothetical protein